jgi:ankyrin repeat domain-containing protein 50
MQGLDSIAASIHRTRVLEDLYRSRTKILQLLSPTHPMSMKEKFEGELVKLYAKLLEYQARSLCYVQKHTIVRTFTDMFKIDGWETLLREIKSAEESLGRFTHLIDVDEVRTQLDRIETTQGNIRKQQKISERENRTKDFLKMLYKSPYKDRKERNRDRVPGTCEWFINHSLFQNWRQEQGSSLLWVSADPGCGKSVLVKYLVDDVLPSTDSRTTCYFFFKDDVEDQRTITSALCALLRQVFLANPNLLSDSLLDRVRMDGTRFTKSFHDLWTTLIEVSSNDEAGEILCLLDALDEAQDFELSRLIKAVTRFYSHDTSRKCKLKFLMTCRPYGRIDREFWDLEQ